MRPIVSQPSATGVIFFGTAPFPTNAPLRAGNNAGVILGYRNFANTGDLSGLSVGIPPASDAGNHDYITLGGALAAQFAAGVGRVIPTVDSVVALGDTFQAFSQVVGLQLVSAATQSFGAGLRIVASLQVKSSGANTPATQFTELSEPQGRLVFTAGNAAGATEVRYNGAVVANFMPTSTTFAVNGMSLGAVGQTWNGLYLSASAAANAPLHLGQGVAPAAPVNGDVWLTGAGVFAQVGGLTVGPFIAAGGGGAINIQNAGVALAGSPFPTFNFLGGGVTNAGGGIAAIPAATGNVTDGGMVVGNLVYCSAVKTVNDAGIIFSGVLYTVPHDVVPAVNATQNLGSNALNWNHVHTREIDSDSSLIISVAAGQGFLFGVGGVDQWRGGNQVVNAGAGFELAAGDLDVVNGQFKLLTAGNKVFIKEGVNAALGVAALVGGTITVNTTRVTATTRIFLTSDAPGGTLGFVSVSARVAGTSFTITSSNALDTSSVAWLLVEPA